uniref:Uncharacterized protein n=1 Tax=Sinocyclocheilus rhinocerous TaxID=307959 RepID=A0A673IRH4_9TELE
LGIAQNRSFVCCRIYMDYNATTPVDPEVVRVVTDALTEAWGNPSSNYLPGMRLSKIDVWQTSNMSHLKA